MLKFVLLLSFALAARASTLAERVEADNLRQVRRLMQENFNITGLDLFSQRLARLPDQGATSRDVEDIVGSDFQTVRRQWESVRRFAINLVIGPMQTFEEGCPEAQGPAVVVFADFYDLMRHELSPETVAVNKEQYLVAKRVPEEAFTAVYTRLTGLYARWPPLRDEIDKHQHEVMERVIDLVFEKLPDYQPAAAAPFDNTDSFEVQGPPAAEVAPTPELMHEEVYAHAAFKVKSVLHLGSADLGEIQARQLKVIGGSSAVVRSLWVICLGLILIGL